MDDFIINSYQNMSTLEQFYVITKRMSFIRYLDYLNKYKARRFIIIEN